MGHERAGAEIVLDRDIGRAAGERGQYSEDQQGAHEQIRGAMGGASVPARPRRRNLGGSEGVR